MAFSFSSSSSCDYERSYQGKGWNVITRILSCDSSLRKNKRWADHIILDCTLANQTTKLESYNLDWNKWLGWANDFWKRYKHSRVSNKNKTAAKKKIECDFFLCCHLASNSAKLSFSKTKTNKSNFCVFFEKMGKYEW